MSQLSPRPRKVAAQIDRITVIRLAGLVPCDPRTVEDYVHARRKTSHAATAGIKRALQTLGVADPRA